LNKDVQSLNDLHACLKSPLLVWSKKQLEYDDRLLLQDLPQQQFVIRIQDRFPNIPLAMAEALGNENSDRYIRLNQVRSHQFEDILDTSLPSDYKSKATTFINSDSGYGSADHSNQNAQPAPLVAPSTKSSKLSSLNEDGRSRYPIFPPKGESGEPFECATCGRLIIARTKNQYRYLHFNFEVLMLTLTLENTSSQIFSHIVASLVPVRSLHSACVWTG
jgi:hypothetical protein